jgi:glutathione S-transferase
VLKASPAIHDTSNNVCVYESAIINEYLSDLGAASTNAAKANKEATILPVDAYQRAKLRLFNDDVDSTINPAFFTFLMNKDPEKDDVLRDKLQDAIQILQTALGDSGGPFLMGREFTLADAHVLPFFLRMVVSLEHFLAYTISTARFPAVLECATCSQRPSVQTASIDADQIKTLYQMFRDANYKFGGLNKN